MSSSDITLTDMALIERKGPLAFIVSLFGIRLLDMISSQYASTYLMFGVLPFRKLTVTDCYEKHVVSIG